MDGGSNKGQGRHSSGCRKFRCPNLDLSSIMCLNQTRNGVLLLKDENTKGLENAELRAPLRAGG